MIKVNVIIANNKKDVKNIVDMILENYWSFKRIEVPNFNELNFQEVKNIKERYGSNYQSALTFCLNDLGVDSFNISLVNYEPRFDIVKSRNKGFSFHGRNYLMIAVREFEKNHIEITYTTFTDWNP